MASSALFRQARDPEVAAPYLDLVRGRNIVLSFVTVTELRFGALKGGWGDLRRRALERDLAALPVVQPDDRLMSVCASLRDRCQRAGHPLGQKLPEADRWIAATANPARHPGGLGRPRLRARGRAHRSRSTEVRMNLGPVITDRVARMCVIDARGLTWSG